MRLEALEFKAHWGVETNFNLLLCNVPGARTDTPMTS